jgi:hypothetical protein
LSNPVHVRCGKGSRGSDPRLLRPNNGLATRPHIGERPRASRIVQALGLDQPSINTIAQQDRQLKRRDPYGLGASTCTAFRAAGLWRWELRGRFTPMNGHFGPAGPRSRRGAVQGSRAEGRFDLSVREHQGATRPRGIPVEPGGGSGGYRANFEGR